jgi:hypothetical protein
MIVEDAKFKLIGFRKSHISNKKYDAIIFNKNTNKQNVIPFGSMGYQHYFDKLGLYEHLNHNDITRRERYYKRHYTNYGFPKADYWSKVILW